MKVYTYQCHQCNWTVLSPSHSWECPYCGYGLQLLNVVEAETYPDIETAMEDVMAGFEKLLAENDGN